MLAEWGFPETIVAAVEHGHGEAGDMGALARVVDLTDNVVRMAGFGLTSDECEWGVPQDKLEALGLTHDMIERVQSDALARFHTIEEAAAVA
jgi:hypothetical protein